MNGVNFDVVCGDLLKEKVDAIVCCTDSQFSVDDSLLSAVVKSGGTNVARACAKMRAVKPLADDDAAITAAGDLPARYVILVRRPRDIDHCMQVLCAALLSAKEKSFKSIALPILKRDNSPQQTPQLQQTSMATDGSLGPPVRNEKPQQLSKGVLVACMTDALALAAQRKALGRLRLVRLVTLNENDRILLTDSLSHSLSGRSAIENALNVEAEQRREAMRRRKESSADDSDEKRWRDIELDRTTSTSAAVEAANESNWPLQ